MKTRIAAIAALLTFASGARAARRPPTGVPVNLSASKIVDLTHPFDEKTIYWPNAPSGFVLHRESFGKSAAGYFYAANDFCAPEHGGTHLDAPIHFSEGKRTVDQIPVRQLVGPGVVIDVAAKAAADRDYRLSLEDVRAWERKHGPVPTGAIVLLRTGWSSRWPDRKAYLGDDTPGRITNLHFPSYGREAAEYLVGKRRAGAIGVDTASIDYGPSTDFIVHRTVLGENVPGLENLAALDALPETGFWVIALPMKIAGGSGAPLRVVAILPR
ncbi:MAG TPA: cyclase family protein [Thermoanaerobaculia bacterium]|jgi:kynurenine formamidase|nr:cyclase family protein [Thermoanaerobaculia bacterium]